MDLKALNSATKYPSIETYHRLDGGTLTEDLNHAFTGNVIFTEKVDGTNVRVIQLPGGDYWIGSRNELLYAKGDRWGDHREGIIEHMRPVADRLTPVDSATPYVHVFFFEVYGGKIGPAHKQYTSKGAVNHLLFDVALIPLGVLGMQPSDISAWREDGGQLYLYEAALQRTAEQERLLLTPRLGTVSAEQLPTTLAGMDDWLGNQYAVHSLAMIDGSDTPGASEGVVLRTHNRAVIAKARHADYAKALRNPKKRRS